MNRIFGITSSLFKQTRWKFIEFPSSFGRLIFSRKMSTFTSIPSPITGKMEWEMHDEDYDFHQEIARSAYADMLHDTERNKKYRKGLQKAIELMHGRGEKAHVLDIGTGTGLLSMMAVQCGADTVTACEAFAPMASCAAKVMLENNMEDKITLIHKRSTDVLVGPDGDMAQRANILVTEIFDTELIGEGAIATFHHAHQCLLETDCFVIPRAANLYVQLAESEFFAAWNRLQPIHLLDCADITPPVQLAKCSGAPSLHDLQMNQIPKENLLLLTEPCKVFRFDYTRQSEILFKGSSSISTSVVQDGQTDTILMWWDLEMDPEGEVILSCAPHWAHPEGREIQWRDHWMQAIYYPESPVSLVAGSEVSINSSHDDYSLWFDVKQKDDEKSDSVSLERPVCVCGAHIAYSRPRLAMLSDPQRNEVYIQAVKQHVTAESICLCLSDGSLLPLILARMGAKKVYTVEPNPMCRRIIEAYIQHNELSDKICVLEKELEKISVDDLDGEKVDIVIGEPFFTTSLLPWHNLYYWYGITSIRSLLKDDATVLPSHMCIKAIAVKFRDLWKIRAPVKDCEGFDLSSFDNLIESASEASDAYMEPHPLWEYPGTAISEEVTLLTLDLTSPVTDQTDIGHSGIIDILCAGICNGVAAWVEYTFGDITMTTGVAKTAVPGEVIHWDPYVKQAVHLFKTPRTVNPGAMIHWTAEFEPDTGDFDFSFVIK